jgi:flagellar biosynthesis protein FlhB
VSADKPFEATPQRRERALREGNVARSVELGTIAAFAGALVAGSLAVPLVAAAARGAVAGAARYPFAPPLPALTLLAFAACVPAGGAAAGAVVAGVAQSGALRPVALKLSVAKLAPGAGLKRMFGGEAAVGALRATLALAAALAALVPLAREVIAGAATLASPFAAATLVGAATLRAALVALAVGALFAFADYGLARRRWLAGLRMSFEEMKREAKENEGDPQVKARRRRAHHAALRSAISRTREASFVIVNPTHVAIALRYAPPEIPVPTILVRAADDAARRVTALARAHAIPLVEDVALARLLYAIGEPGRAIPAETFVAVAQIVASLAREGLLT